MDFDRHMKQNDEMNRKLFPQAFALAVALLANPSPFIAQQTPGQLSRGLQVSVTDPLNRFVTGLTSDQFSVVESGVARTIVSFSSADDPIAVAVVSAAPLADLNKVPGPSQLIQTSSISDAVRQLIASDKPRKALIVSSTVAAANETIPGGIFAVRADVDLVSKSIVEVCNQYTLGFVPEDRTANVEVVLKQPRGLPALKVNRLLR